MLLLAAFGARESCTICSFSCLELGLELITFLHQMGGLNDLNIDTASRLLEFMARKLMMLTLWAQTMD